MAGAGADAVIYGRSVAMTSAEFLRTSARDLGAPTLTREVVFPR
jgi:hypothetical protein